MESIFKQALKYLGVNEGGFTNHPNDKGGATNYGITRSDLARWLRRSVTVDEVKNMTYQTAADIYEAWYWKSINLDKITNQAIAIALFDMGVLRGIGWPIKQAQAICIAHGYDLGKSGADNDNGPKTQAALNAIDTKEFIEAYEGICEAGFRSIVARNPSQKVFLKGWLNRSKRLLTLVPKEFQQDLTSV